MEWTIEVIEDKHLDGCICTIKDKEHLDLCPHSQVFIQKEQQELAAKIVHAYWKRYFDDTD